jgi:hypothetical protein
MTADLFDPPELRLPDDAVARRRAHLLAEIGEANRHIGWKLVLPVAAAAAALVAAVVLVGRPATTRLTLVDQALAAVGNGPAFHVVLEVPDAAQLVDVRTGTSRSLALRESFWSDPKLGTLFVRSLDGRVAQRQVFPRGESRLATTQWRPFVAGYQQELRDGSFRVVGSGRVGGRAVEWIANDKGEQIAISKTTYRPLFIRYVRNGRVLPGTSARVVLAQTTAPQPSRFSHVKRVGAFGGGMTSTPAGTSGGIPTTIAAARAAMHPDPIVPQAAIAGLRRTWIGLPNYLLPPATSYKDEVNGLTLYYGQLDGYGYPRWAGRYVAINEIPDRHDAEAIWGHAYFRDGAAVVITPGDTTETTATIELHGLSVAIQASDRAAAIAAVRALAR